jgi:hypothetical protein
MTEGPKPRTERKKNREKMKETKSLQRKSKDGEDILASALRRYRTTLWTRGHDPLRLELAAEG